MDRPESVEEMRQKGEVERLIEALHDPLLAADAAEALGELREARAIGPLIQALFEAPSPVRPAVVKALTRFADPRVAVALMKATHDPDEAVRTLATEAVEMLTPPRHAGDDRDLAADPRTPERRLAELAATEDPEIVVALVRNPSTPAETLRAIYAKWKNAPNRPTFLVGDFVSNATCPADVLADIAETSENEETARAARGHPNHHIDETG